MGYPLGLNEYEERRLIDELALRDKMRREGKCDYCYQPVSGSKCRFPERHKLRKLTTLRHSTVASLIEQLSKIEDKTREVCIKGLTDPRECFEGEIIDLPGVEFITLCGIGSGPE